MRVRVNKKELFDRIILWGMILQVILMRWLDLHEQFNYFIVAIILIRVLFDIKGFIKPATIFPFILLIGYLTINWIVIGGSTYLVLKNSWRIIKVLIPAWYFCSLLKNRTYLVDAFFDRKYTFFTIYLFINIPIIIAQLNKHYILLGLRKGYIINSVDFVIGLFGIYGMPRLDLYILFVFFFSLYKYLTDRNKTYNRLSVVLCSVFFLFWVVKGFEIDNKGFYICAALYSGVFYLIYRNRGIKDYSEKHKDYSMWTRVFALIAVSYFFVLGLARSNSTINSYIKEIKFTVNEGFLKKNLTGGTTERFGMIAYAFSNSNIRWHGAGIGKIATDSSGAFGFNNFGQSDFGSYLCAGGLIVIICIALIMYQLFREIFISDNYSILITSVFFALSIYTQVLTDAALTNEYLFFVLICYKTMKIGRKEKRDYRSFIR